MGMDCCCRFLKIIVFIINIMIIMIGIAVLALGVLVIINNNELEKHRQDDSSVLIKIFAAIIAMGALLVCVGFTGCCGAVYENQCLLSTFVFFMVVALAIDIAAAILIENNKDNIKTETEAIVKNLFNNVTTENLNVINRVQTTFRCCGKNGPKDWSQAKMDIPSSCCVEPGDKCTTSTNPNAFFKGCVERVGEIINDTLDHYSIILLSCVGIAETLALVISLGLCCYIKKGNY